MAMAQPDCKNTQTLISLDGEDTKRILWGMQLGLEN